MDHAQLEVILGRLVRTLLEQQSQNGRSLASCHDAFQPLLKVEYDDYYVNQIVDQIKQSYQTKVTVSDLIQHIDVSESYAMRTFKDHVGITNMRLFKSLSYFTISAIVRSTLQTL